MSIGIGIMLLVLGAIFVWVIEVDLPGINQFTLGYILMAAGIAVIVLSFVLGALRGRSRVVTRTDVAPHGERVTETHTANNQTDVV